MLPALPKNRVRACIPGIDAIYQVFQGGQKYVYHATIRGESYALKVVPLPVPTSLGLLNPQSLSARVKREVEILSACNSPHLVQLGPLGLTPTHIDGVPVLYYTEEWIEGRNLQQMTADDGPLSVKQVIGVARDVAIAIDCLSKKNKVHRDIKPGNIMQRQSTGDFVLLDLGLALDRYDASLTATGMVPGTYPYLSPEQCDPRRKRTLDCRSDLFALGVVLYEVSTGMHPFFVLGMSQQDTMKRIIELQPDSPSTLRSDLPPDLANVIMKLMQKQPYQRYKSSGKLLEALDKLR